MTLLSRPVPHSNIVLLDRFNNVKINLSNLGQNILYANRLNENTYAYVLHIIYCLGMRKCLYVLYNIYIIEI